MVCNQQVDAKCSNYPLRWSMTLKTSFRGCALQGFILEFILAKLGEAYLGEPKTWENTNQKIEPRERVHSARMATLSVM